jgi:ATP-dependent RNA helicase DDX3X
MFDTQWEDADLHPVLIENLKLAGYDKPTPVQQWSLKAIKTGRDILMTAATGMLSHISRHPSQMLTSTGSGKTGAYLVPVLDKFFGKVKQYCKPRPSIGGTENFVAEPIVLIIVPTRELAAQVFNEMRRLSYRSYLRPCAAYGGGPVKIQLAELQKGCDILVGTLGRLNDYVERDRISFKRVKAMVMDEADEVLKEEWRDDMQKVFLGNRKCT